MDLPRFDSRPLTKSSSSPAVARWISSAVGPSAFSVSRMASVADSRSVSETPGRGVIVSLHSPALSSES